MAKSKIKTLSLFSGAGGLDIGFHLAGYDIVACVELEKKYCKTLEANRAKGKYIGGSVEIHNIDIRDFDASRYKDMGIECVIGGPPCQTFSAAGRRSGGVIGTDDERGQLYNAYCSILDELQPKVFVFENVYGLPGANGGGPWREILKAFAKHGYQLHAEVLDTADYEVPQHRERLIMVGTRGIDFRFPKPIVGPDSGTSKPLVSVLTAIADLQNKNEKYSAGLGGLYGHLLPEIPEGLNYAFFTAEMGHPEPVFAWRSKFHDLLYKVNRNEPARTIKANPGKFTGPFHWKNRHFTIDELKRLQTFPDDYEIVGSYGHVVEQIGNSVPPKLAKILGESVKEQIIKPKRKLTYEPRDSSFLSTFRARQRERSLKFKEIAQVAIKKKYGAVIRYEDASKIKPKTIQYYSSYPDKFTRVTHRKNAHQGSRYLSCTLTETLSHIRLDVDEQSENENSLDFSVHISGLKKYLPKFDTLKVSAKLSSPTSIFFVWKEISEALVNRSKFFTLIDIYGHYANRGDVVEITSSLTEHGNSQADSQLISFINFVGQTSNCGDIVSIRRIANFSAISLKEIDDLVERARELRFDIRTSKTHPIIGPNNILCTYPFPLLSKKAMVESKVKLNIENTYERKTDAAL